MPAICFSYPPGTGNREVVAPVRDSKICFSYQAGAVPPPPESKLCFSYQASAVPLPPESKLCFSYTVTHRFRY
jgi:hypothetical protein